MTWSASMDPRDGIIMRLHYISVVVKKTYEIPYLCYRVSENSLQNVRSKWFTNQH